MSKLIYRNMVRRRRLASLGPRIANSFLWSLTGAWPNNLFTRQIVYEPRSLPSIVTCLRRARRRSGPVYAGTSRFVWIVGLPRTGGSYTSRVLRRNLFNVTGDDVIYGEIIPSHDLFAEGADARNLAREFGQLFTYLEDFYSDYDLIVKKNSGAGTKLDWLAYYIGDLHKLAGILVTVRHPGEVYRSYLNTGLNLASLARYVEGVDLGSFVDTLKASKPETQQQSDRLKEYFLAIWYNYYRELVERCSPQLRAKLSVVPFGFQNEVLDSFIQAQTGRRARELDAIKNRSKDTGDPFFEGPRAQAAINDLRERYQARNLAFI